MERLTSVDSSRRGWAVHGLALVLLLAVPLLVPNRFELFNAGLLGLFLVGAMSMNLLLITGLISIGHSALYMLGGYFVAVLTVTHGIPFWVALVLGALVSAIVGYLSGLPSLRLGLFTLAMVTLGYAIVAEKLAIEWRGVTGGANGLAGVKFPSLFPSLESYYWLIAILVVLTYVLMHNMIRSPFGRAGSALGSQPVAAEAVGIEPRRIRLLAFTVSSGLAGLAGGLYVPLLGFIAPDAFGIHFAILILLMPILGGSATLAGPIVGTIALFRLPIEIERVTAQPGEWSLLVFGVVLVLSVHFIPRGMMGGWQSLMARRRTRQKPEETGTEDEAGWTGQASIANVLEPVNEPGEILCEAEGARKNFDGVQALDGMDLRLEAGSTHALIGPNGSGKTTFLNTVSGFLGLDAGSERAFGKDLSRLSPAARARLGLARTFQTPLVFGEMSCLENVLVALDMRRERSLLAYAVRSPSARREEREQYQEAVRLLGAVGLPDRRDEPAGDLPPGQTRLLEIARVLALRPRVVLMDEPAAGLNDEEIVELEGVIRALAESGVGVILVEHHAEMVMRLSDVVTVIDFGSIIAHGPPEAVRRDPKVLEAYLGDEGVEDETPTVGAGEEEHIR